MNKFKLLIRNSGILFEFLPVYFKRIIIHSLKEKKNLFRVSRTPKTNMYASIILAVIFALNNHLFSSIFFLLLSICFWMQKIWISGEPMKWYSEKYLVKNRNI